MNFKHEIQYKWVRNRIRKLGTRPVMLGVTHVEELLRPSKKILKQLRKNHQRIGLELPIDYELLGSGGEIRFFSPLARFAKQIGFEVVPLDILRKNNELAIKRVALAKIMNAAPFVTDERDSFISDCQYAIEQNEILMLEVYKLKALFLSNGINYLPHERLVDLFGPTKIRNMHLINARDFDLEGEFYKRQLETHKLAKKIVEGSSEEQIRRSFLEINNIVDNHMLSRIREFSINCLVIGLGHSRKIDLKLPHKHLVFRHKR